MDNAVVMDVFEALDDAGCEEFGLVLCKTPVSADMITEVASRLEVHDQIEVVSVLESGEHVDYIAKQSDWEFTCYEAWRADSAR